jgi:hypothetical protein
MQTSVTCVCRVDTTYDIILQGIFFYPIFKESNMKEKHLLELNIRLASVNSLQNNMNSLKSLKIPYFSHPKSKSHNIKSIKSKSSRSKAHHNSYLN